MTERDAGRRPVGRGDVGGHESDIEELSLRYGGLRQSGGGRRLDGPPHSFDFVVPRIPSLAAFLLETTHGPACPALGVGLH